MRAPRFVFSVPLFVSKGYQRIRTHRAARGNGAGQNRRDEQDYRDSHKCKWIGAFHTEKQTCKRDGCSASARRTKNESSDRQLHSLPHEQTENITRSRAQRHADANFSGSPFDTECQSAVEADARQR